MTGNNDDHARNHAAFWDGTALTRTPAYDICPQPRAGGETAQLMAIGEDGYRMSQVAGAVARVDVSALRGGCACDRRPPDRHDRNAVGRGSDRAGLTEIDRPAFWRRQFLNPYATEGY